MGAQHPLQLPLIISHLRMPLAHPLETDHSWKVSADFAISWLWRSKNEKYYFRLIIRQIMKISFFSGWIASPFGYLSNQVDGIVDRSAFPRHSYRVWAGSSARTPSKFCISSLWIRWCWFEQVLLQGLLQRVTRVWDCMDCNGVRFTDYVWLAYLPCAFNDQHHVGIWP